MIKGLRTSFVRVVVALALLACTLPGYAQTRAWLDRDQVTYGETATLNIETDDAVKQIDYAPLAARFDIAGQTVRRSFQLVNGHSSTRSLFAVGIRPRGPGVVTVPALRVGNGSTEPLQLTVMAPTVQPAGNKADAFVETELDADRPYVQQAVGMVVRLFVGVNLLSGQLDQDQPPGTSLQQVGDDVRYQRLVDGRRYDVIERRYLLIPERSGAVSIPGARFNGQSISGFFDGAFGDGRKTLSAAAPERRLQVQPIPPGAPQPWLPLHDLRLRYLQVPKEARAGAAAAVELEMTADGASPTQLPALAFPPSKDAQVFADPPQTDVQLVDGRPRTTLRQRISIVPLHAGPLSLAGPSVAWWDATQGVARSATLPPLHLEVAPGTATSGSRDEAGSQDATPSATRGSSSPDVPSTIAREFASIGHVAPWLAAILGLVALLLGGWWFARRRKAATRADAADASSTPATPPKSTSLPDALKTGELAVIADALCRAAGVPGDDVDALRMRLDDAAQVEAVARLQAARWGDGDAAAAVASLRAAFAKGLRLHRKGRVENALLPPLYPKS